MEVGCLDHGIELPAQGRVRRFYQEMPFMVGASAGEETFFIYVEWEDGGDIHGRPITWRELVKNKGAGS